MSINTSFNAFKKTLLVTAMLSFLPSWALAAGATSFSPYLDLTLDTVWSNDTNENEPVDLVALSTASGVKDYHLAFIVNTTGATTCSPAWAGIDVDYNHFSTQSAWGQSQLNALRAAGVPYTISFGGQAGVDISMACSSDQLLDAYETVINTYQPAGLDFDIENNNTTTDVDKVMTALVSVQKAYPSVKLSFTLPVMPTGLVAEGQTVLNAAAAHNLQYTVNLMAMDYNLIGDMGQFATQAATSVHAFLATLYPTKTSEQLWAMIGLTPMIGRNDNGSPFELKDAATVQGFADQNHLALLSMWSFNRDHPRSAQTSHDGNHDSADWDGTNYQSQDYDFSHAFQGL